jgi:excisionase family DNA binding protein
MFNQPAANQPHMTLQQAAARLGMGVWTLRACIRDGEIGYVRLGNRRGCLFVTETQLSDYLTRRTVPAQAQAA